MAFRNILEGRKALVSTRSHTKVAPEMLSLVRAFAAQYGLYHIEAVSYLIAVGLSQHEGWLLTDDQQHGSKKQWSVLCNRNGIIIWTGKRGRLELSLIHHLAMRMVSAWKTTYSSLVSRK